MGWVNYKDNRPVGGEPFIIVTRLNKKGDFSICLKHFNAFESPEIESGYWMYLSQFNEKFKNYIVKSKVISPEWLNNDWVYTDIVINDLLNNLPNNNTTVEEILRIKRNINSLPNRSEINTEWPLYNGG